MILKNQLTRRYSKVLFPYLLATPAVIYILGMFIYPLFYSLKLSLRSIRLYELTTGGKFIGLENYIRILQEPRFWNALGNTATFVVISVGLELLFGLGIAMLLNTKLKGRSFWRAIIITPLMLTPVVVGINFKMFFNYLFGIANWFLGLFGLGPVQWLSHPFWAMFSVITTEVWNQTPFVVLIVLAGLQSIPNELNDAAKVDGANELRKFLYITLPMLKPMLYVAIFWRTVATFRVYDIIFILTGGGPSYSTESVSILVSNLGFSSGRMGYATALAFLMILIMIVFAILYNKKIQTI